MTTSGGKRGRAKTGQAGRLQEPMRQRLVGAAVLAALLILVIPLLLDDSERREKGITTSNIPPRPQGEFGSSVVPLDTRMPAPAVDAAEVELVPADAPLVTEPLSPVPPGTADEATGAGQRIGVSAWVVQLGSFAAAENAAALEKRVKDAGYSAFVEQLQTGEGQVFRVRVGPELLRADAQSIRDRLESEINLKGIVVRYP